MRTVTVILVLGLVWAALPAPVAGAAEPDHRFSATFVVDSTQGTRRMPATIVAHRYTPVEEAQGLRGVLERGGQGALLGALRGRQDGHLELGAMRIPIAMAVARELDDGFRYFFITPRRIRYDEREESKESLDFPFGIAYFDVAKNGRGEGTIHVAATLVIAEDGWVEIIDYIGTEGQLTDLRVLR